MKPIHYDDLDLLMRACERMGYGPHYGRFAAELSAEERARILEEERRRQDRRDALRRKAEEKERIRMNR